jgi:hypothetical protein
MNDFKKGLLVGIVIMSSIFLFIGSTAPQMWGNDRKEIVEYQLVDEMNEEDLNKSAMDYISKGYQPYGSPFGGMKGMESIQAFVKYK